MQQLRYLGRLYDFDGDDKDRMVQLQDILDQYAANQSTGTFDIEGHMKKVNICIIKLIAFRWSRTLENCPFISSSI